MGELKFTYAPALWWVLPIGVLLVIGLSARLLGRKAPFGLSLAELFGRSLALICLCIAIAGPYREVTTSTASAVALIDISDSMDESVAQGLLDQMRSFISPTFNLDLIPFAKTSNQTSLSGREVSSFHDLKNSWAKLDIGGTNIEEALASAAGQGGNIFLLSDGRETLGDLNRAAPALAGASSRVYPFAPGKMAAQAPVFKISNLYAPLIAPAMKSVDIRASVLNLTGDVQEGELEIKHDQKVVFKKTISVGAGKEELVVTQSDPSKQGIKEITATLTPSNGSFSSSSETVFLSGEEREKILLIGGSEQDNRFLDQVFKEQSYQLTTEVADQKGTPLPDLNQFSTVLLNNVALEQLSKGSDRRIEEYVKGGGGFIMLGGNKSFGLGGYMHTPIEDALPVNLVPPQTVKKRLNIAVELVMDKSRSMSVGEKLEFAKEGAKEVIRALKDDDFVGVIGFDTSPFVVVRLDQLGTIRETALDRVNRLFPAGKTNLMPAMDEARRSLVRVNAGRKHMIILTDGQLPDAGPYYPELVRQMRVLGITVSTIMLGSEADIGLLREMAEVGGGAFYQTADARNLPKIFLSDIKVGSGEKTLQEQQEYLVRPGTGEITSTALRSFPPLRGYVQTKPKPKANLELVLQATDKAEPLLASWQYGKGKSVAFTSDVNGRWSNYWVSWNKFYQFWTELLDAVRPKGSSEGGNIRFELRNFVERGALVLDLTIYSEQASGQVAAQVKLPDGTIKQVNFASISAGHYRSTLENATAGKYEITGQVGARKLTPVAFNLSGELFGERKGLGFDLANLERMASLTGGVVNPTLADLKLHEVKKVTKNDLTWLPLLLGLILLCLEILRREVYSPFAFKRV